MSIDYRTFFGLGWVLTEENLNYCRKQNIEIYDYFDDNFLHIIDAYTEEENLFLGIDFFGVDAGEVVEIGTLNTENYVQEEEMQKLKKIAKNSFNITSPPLFCLVSTVS